MSLYKIITPGIIGILLSFAGQLYAQTTLQHTNSVEFIENKDQWEPNVLYKADINSGAVFLERNCFTYVFKDVAAMNKISEFKHVAKDKRPKLTADDYIIKHHAYKVKFVEASKDVKVKGDKPYEGYYNFFIGDDKSKWASRVHSYNKVAYTGLYTKTDMNIYESDSQLKYDLILHQGANAGNIRLLYDGVDTIYISNNNLIVKTSVNEVTELSPVAYQMINGRKIKVSCKFKLTGNELSFIFPDGYDESGELVIDPTLIFSTYSGSTADNWGFTATYDTAGCAYSGGIAFGTGYPVSTGAYQVNFAGGDLGGYLTGCDIAIIKYNPIGTQRLWATYLGGSKNDLPHSMIVNNLNELVIYGTTGSSDFPVTTGSYDGSFNGGSYVAYDQSSLVFSQGIDIFVSKLSFDGTQLLASTYLGGTGNDGLNYPSVLSFNYGDGARGEIMTDASNNVYIVSTTNSTDFPTTSGVFQSTPGGGGQDGVVVKLDPDLTSLLWSSYLGGSNADAVYGIVLDNSNNVYVTGGTASGDFPTTSGTLQTSYQGGSSDGFITEISSNGSSILKSTFYGSDAYDQSYLIEKGPTGKIYVYGQTSKTGNAFITNATWATPGGGQFVSKLEPDLSSVIWSTAFGTGNGGPDISPDAFLVDNCNYIYMSGWGGLGINGFGGTYGLPITSDAYQMTTDGNDFYFLVIDDNASSMIYGSYFGSPSAYEHVDGGTSRYDRKGIIYQGVCGGCGGYSNFPTTVGAWSQTNNSSNCNNAIIKYDFQLTGVVVQAAIAPTDSGCVPFTVNFTSTCNVPNFVWNFDDPTSGTNNTSTLQNPTHTYNIPGIYHVTFIGTDSTKCNIADTATVAVSAFLVPTVNLGPDTIICPGTSISLNAGNPGMSYLWSTGANTQSIIVADSGYYWVNVSAGMCNRADSVIVKQKKEMTYEIPNVFTPNNDGLNDEFKVMETAVDNFDCKIFNRWGKKIYEWTNPTSGWDGRINQAKAADGVYYYILKFGNDCGSVEKHGTVTLMRK